MSESQFLLSMSFGMVFAVFLAFRFSTQTTKQISVVDLRCGWSLSSVAAVMSSNMSTAVRGNLSKTI